MSQPIDGEHNGTHKFKTLILEQFSFAQQDSAVNSSWQNSVKNTRYELDSASKEILIVKEHMFEGHPE